MAWIKRNLFFSIVGILALGLLGAAGFYIFQGWSRNSEASAKLTEIVNNLKNLAHQNPAPGNEKTDNIQIAKDQEQQIHAWIAAAGANFQPIPPIPPGAVTSETFTAALRRTIDQLQHEADDAGVALPPQYSFSFKAQRNMVKFAPDSLDPLATKLGEVRAISEILYAARINVFDGIQRIRVSDEDVKGPQSDYLDELPVTNDLAVMTPFVVTLRCFTPELSRVIAGFASSSNTFIVKSINIQPAGAAPAGMPSRPVSATGAEPAPGRGGLQTVLKEQLLRITLEVELVKLSPQSY
jgi:hypothetical protein